MCWKFGEWEIVFGCLDVGILCNILGVVGWMWCFVEDDWVVVVRIVVYKLWVGFIIGKND